MELKELCQAAAQSKFALQKLTEDQKNEVLSDCAVALMAQRDKILKANAVDLENAVKKGLSEGIRDRLMLNPSRIIAMAQGIRAMTTLPDPVGEILDHFERPNGLVIEKKRVPIGVIGIIYEARPNVTADAFGLCFKTGNVVILKGGSDAVYSNQAIVEVLQSVLVNHGVPSEVLSLITDVNRLTTLAFMKMNEYVDLLIPRGGAGLISNVVQNANIPVIETGTGNCHVYVDEYADLAMAVEIVNNAKTQRISVCNACESLLVHEKVKDAFLPMLYAKLKESHVEIRGDQAVCALIPEAVAATEQDYATEFLDYILSVKTVSSVEEAIDHINKFNTGHSESIVTGNDANAQLFLDGVDAACVYVNASTRFTDGFEFGFGGEIGISTQMLHARGPMGLKELTSYKYQIRGNGQIRG